MNPVTSLSLGRIAVGAIAIAKPDVLTGPLGIRSNAELLHQWFGHREIALGLATLVSSGSSRRNLVLIGMAVDAADAVTAYQGVEQKALTRNAGLASAGVAVSAVVSGLLGLRVKKKPSRRARKKAAA
ncbi:hypothetical protein [Nocardioides sp. R-C-SC26]|uniref:hypothetical protein n=1 Tax=Nocardioides sp. R-C-SC26 TaxID=2870414 RepID=UPI001E2E2E75|nr:hypothetical protein [Nocardioides sp. R-C-SC26]